MLKYFKFFLFIVFFSITFTSCFEKNISEIQKLESDNSYSCKYKENVRKFNLWLPENIENKGIIIMLHGYGESTTSFMNKTNMNDYALPKGYGVCYVSSGSEPGWNSGSGVSKKDDYGFLCTLTYYLIEEYEIPKNNVFLCGFSNGAFMCHYSALQKKNPFNGIVAVAGLAPSNIWEKNKKNCHVNLFEIYGTKDDLVLSKEKAKENVVRGFPFIEEVIETWVEENNLEFDCNLNLGERSILKKYYSDKNLLWVLQIKDYPHQWPEERSTGYELSDITIDFLESIKS